MMSTRAKCRGIWGTGLVAAGICLTVSGAPGDYPSWWTNRNVIDTSAATTNDYAVANAGQLKCFATNAYDELEANLPDGAGTNLASIVAAFASSNNYVGVNLGQLKYVVEPIYDRLIAEGYTNAYPWTTATADDNDYSLVNIGQLKHAFNFTIPTESPDADDDDIIDWWEQVLVNNSTNDIIEKVDHVLDREDYDGDGVSNADEYAMGTDATDDTDIPPLLGFAQREQTVAEAGTNITVSVEVTLLPASVTAVYGTVAVSGGNATSNGVDYSFTDQSLSFAVGETSKQVNVTIICDTNSQVREPQESIWLTVTKTSGHALTSRDNFHAILINDYHDDTDGDGIPDWWELQYFGGVTNASPTADEEPDGWNNLVEYYRGGNPTNAWAADTNNVLQLVIHTPLRGD